MAVWRAKQANAIPEACEPEPNIVYGKPEGNRTQSKVQWRGILANQSRVAQVSKPLCRVLPKGSNKSMIYVRIETNARWRSAVTQGSTIAADQNALRICDRGACDVVPPDPAAPHAIERHTVSHPNLEE
ncbi:hypothetical protein GmRootA79_38850 [Acidovorax sp. A79]